MPAPNGNTVSVVLTMDGASYSAALDKAQKQLDQFKGKAGETGTSVAGSMQKSRESIKLLGEEIGVHLPRGLQSFVAELPGVSAAMSAAFNAVAVLALISVVVEAGKKVAEFVEKGKKAGEESAKAWNDALQETKKTLAEQIVSNDKLQDQVDKIEKKPRNAIKDAIDEAVLSTINLNSQLNGVLDKIASGIKEEGILQQLGIQSPGASPVKGELENLQARLAQNSIDTQAAVAKAKTVKEKEAAQNAGADKDISDANQSKGRLKTLADGVTGTSYNPETGKTQNYNNNPELTAAVDAATAAVNNVITLTGLDKNRVKNQDIIDAHSGDKDKNEAAQRASEAALNKDVNFAKNFDPTKDAGKITAYWSAIAHATKVGSAEYKGAIDKWTDAHTAMRKQITEMNKKASDGTEAPSVAGNLGKMWGQPTQSIADSASSWRAYHDQIADSSLIDARGTYASTTEGVSYAQRTGAMSKEAGDKVLIAALQELTAAEKAALVAKLDVNQQALNSLKPGDKDYETKLPELQAQHQQLINQIDSANMQSAEAFLKATQQLSSDSVWGQLRDTLSTFVQQVTNVGAVLGNLATHSLSSINNAILNPGKAGSHPWSNAALSIGKSAESSALNFGEGKVLGMFGLGGKHDGSSAANALFVQMSGLGGSAASSVTGAVSSVASSGGLGKLLSGFVHMLGFASGGNANAGTMAMVGEHGPELAYFGSNAHVTPNRAISNMGGKSGGDTYNIDARQSQNPAQVAAYIQHAIKQGQKQSVAQAVSMQHEMSKRKP